MFEACRGPPRGVFNSHWNRAGPTDQLPDPPALPAAVTTANPGEFLTPVQVIRTINGGLLPGPPKGEKGVLASAYLRAIHFAKRFIYLENQYFTNEAITQALIAALKANEEELQLILVVPVEPDIPRYPHWQRGLIQRIAKSLGDAESRFGAFTLWSHAAPDAAHAKARGSARTTRTRSRRSSTTTGPRSARRTRRRVARLLPAPLLLAAAELHLPGRGELQHRDESRRLRAASPRGGSAVDALRRRLWAEHLGFVNPNGRRRRTPPSLGLAAARRLGRTLKERAEVKRKGLEIDPNTVSAVRVPLAARSWRVNPERHLKALKVPVSSYDLVRKGPPSRAFKLGP